MLVTSSLCTWCMTSDLLWRIYTMSQVTSTHTAAPRAHIESITDMQRTFIPRQTLGSGSGNKFMGTGSPQGRNNLVNGRVQLFFFLYSTSDDWQIIGVAALVGLTGLVYWVGYHDVDKRHRNDGRWDFVNYIFQVFLKFLSSPGNLKKPWLGTWFLNYEGGV